MSKKLIKNKLTREGGEKLHQTGGGRCSMQEKVTYVRKYDEREAKKAQKHNPKNSSSCSPPKILKDSIFVLAKNGP